MHERHPDTRAGRAASPSNRATAPTPRVGTFEWNCLTNEVHWSSALEHLHGLEPGAFGSSFDAFLADAHPDDRARLLAKIQRIVDGADSDYHVEYRIVMPDGTLRWVEAHGEVQRDEGGRALALRGVCMDMSDRKSAERHRSAAFALSRALAGARDLDRGLEVLVGTVGEALDCHYVEYWQVDSATSSLRPRVTWQSPDAADGLRRLAELNSVDDGWGLPGLALRAGEPYWIEDLVASELPRRDALLAADLRGALALPVQGADGPLGVIAGFTCSPLAHDESLVESLRLMAGDVTLFARRLTAEEQLRTREQQQAVVAALGDSVLRGMALQQLFDEAARSVAETLDVECTKLLQLLSGGRELRLVAGVGWREGLVGHATVPTGSGSQAAYTLEANGPVIVRDLRRETRFQGARLLEEHGVVSGMSITVPGVDDAPWGVFGVHATRERIFTRDDTIFLQNVVNVLAGAIERDQRQRSQEFLLEASETLFSSLDYRQTLRDLARLAVSEVADWCVVRLTGEAGDESQVLEVAHRDPSKVEMVRHYRERMHNPASIDPIVDRVMRSGRPEMIPVINAEGLRRVGVSDEAVRMLTEELDIRALMVAPLAARGRVFGTISFVSAESGRRFANDDLRTLEELTRRAGIAIDNARLYAQTRDALRTREDFVSVASHELRSPLASILGFSRRLAGRTGGGVRDETAAESLTIILREAERMHRTLELFLEMAGLDTGRSSMNIVETDLAELVAAEAESLRRVHPEVELKERLAPETDLVRTDPVRVRAIVANLLGNAAKYGGEPPRIELSLEREDGDAVVRVSDNGHGIAEEDRERVFERFYRGNGSGGDRPGLGLGLYISRQVAERLGADLSCETAEHGGARFVLRLPVTPPALD